MLVFCTRCGSGKPEDGSGLSFEKYEDWLSHLVSGKHRVAVEGSLRHWKEWEDERSVLVEQTESLTPRQVLEHFAKLGMVGEFFYSKNMKFCVVRVDSLDGRKIQLNGNKEHRISDVKVKVKEKKAVTPTHWNNLLYRPVQPLVPLKHGINAATPLNPVNSNGVADLRIETKNESRQVTVISAKNDAKAGKNKLKGIFSEETSVPGPKISVPTAIINSNIGNQSHSKQSDSCSTSSEIHNGNPTHLQQVNSPNKSKKSKSKNRSKKEKSKAVVLEDQSSHQSGVEVQDADLPSDSGSHKQSEVSVKSQKPELDFRGGFQVGAPYRIPVQNTQASTSNQGLESSNVVRPHAAAQFQDRNLFMQPQSHAGPIPRQVIIPGPQGGLQRQRGPFPAGPPIRIIKNVQQIGPIHLQDPYSQRFGQQYPPLVYVTENRNANYSPKQTYQYQMPVQAPMPRNVRPKYQDLFFDMIENENLTPIRESQLGEMFTRLTLQEQLTEFMRAMTLDERGIQNRQRLVEDMEYVLRQEKDLCRCKIFPFGSFITGLGDIQSDVDIYVDAYGTTDGHNLPPKPLNNIDLLNYCKRILKKARCPRTNVNFCHHLIPIREARVPILKLKHAPSKVQCDLSFENLISVRNSKMISLFMSIHPVVRPLMILLRYWGKFHCLTGSNSVKNYALNLLVLVYLANQKIIPSIADIQNMYWTSFNKNKGNNKAHIIDGWDTSFCTDVAKICKDFKPAILPEQALTNLAATIITLAVGFFEMFANADFSSTIVCTLTAEFLPKSLFKAGYESDLPEFLERYKEWSARQTSDRRLNVKTPLCIQDPFVLSFNVGSVCPQATLLKFQVACVQTMNILKNKQDYRSLLDAFSRLPAEVGDKKFMSLQERQKQTIELIQEIKQQFDGRPKTPEEEPTVASHLRPIQEIVDKKTIMLGKGWQSYQTFQPDTEFQEMFARWIKKCQLNKQLAPETLFQKLKKLWGVFVGEFVDVVWNKCFYLDHNKEHFALKKRLYSGPSLSPKFHKTYESLFMEKKDKKSKDKKDANVPPESVAKLVDQLHDLDLVEEKLVYVREKCSASVAVWERREKLFKKICNGLDDCEAVAKDALAQGNEKPKKKKKERRLVKSARLKLNRNPLDIEEEITKLILDSNSQQAPETPLLVFYCLIKMDFSIVDELPTVYIVFEKDTLTDYHVYCQSVSTFSDIIGSLLPEYACYRLGQWFEQAGLHEAVIVNTTEAQSSGLDSLKKRSKSKLVKEEPADLKETAETAEVEEEDNHEDLLLPPSSDESDDDDNDEPNQND